MKDYLSHTHGALVSPCDVPISCWPERLAQLVKNTQMHDCEHFQCTQRNIDKKHARKDGVDPDKWTAEQRVRYSICSKGFPKFVPTVPNTTTCEPIMEARATADLRNSIRYDPPRDDGMVNNYHPILLHAWGANMDFSVIHKSTWWLDAFRRRVL